MAYDRMHPPDLWESTSARLIHALVCAWSTGSTPKLADFLPPGMSRAPVKPMDENEILSVFGIKGKAS